MLASQVRLPSNAGGELKYVNDWRDRFKLTHRDYLTYVEQDDKYQWTDANGQSHTGIVFHREEPWLKSLAIDEGIDTVELTGLQKFRVYRVGFYETGSSEFNITYKILHTRGKSTKQ